MMQTALHWCLCVFVLLRRRARLLWRNPRQVVLQCALIFGFPAIVVLFALDGLPQIRHAQLEMSRSIVAELLVTLDHLNQVTRVGALVSGITMFQVILLGLVASNNTAREIVARRNIFEKEKLAGLAPSAALCSTALWMSALCLIQTTWMFFFVKTVCGIGGYDLAQFLSLLGTSLAISSTSLAISSWSTSTESASLTSVYLVGFQLPLSGVLLAMPEWMADLTRPFIASYWGWSGYLQSMADTPFLELASQASQPTPVGSLELSLWMLSLHTLAGLFFAWLGLKSARWNTT